MSQEHASSTVDPKAIKPGRFWYVIAAVVIVVTVGAGIAVFVFGASSLAGSVPRFGTILEPDEPKAVMAAADREFAVYAEYPGQDAPGVDCSVESGDGTASLKPADTTFTFTRDGRQWHLVYEFEVDKDGSYTFTCGSDGTVETFAVGRAVDVGGFVGGVFGTIGGLVGIPCFGVVVGGVIILVVTLRRGSSRKRLRERPKPPTSPESPGAW